MSRRDLAADLDRPHFYSQFWLDVASGKRDVAAAPAAEADAEFEEADEAEFEPVAVVTPPPVAVRKPAKASERKAEPSRPSSLTSLADLANIDLLMKSSAEMDGDEVPDLAAGPASDLAPIVTDFDLDEAATEPEAAAEADAEFDAEFDDEEEEEGGGDWGSRRKPSKPQKTERRRDRPEKRSF